MFSLMTEHRPHRKKTVFLGYSSQNSTRSTAGCPKRGHVQFNRTWRYGGGLMLTVASSSGQRVRHRVAARSISANAMKRPARAEGEGAATGGAWYAFPISVFPNLVRDCIYGGCAAAGDETSTSPTRISFRQRVYWRGPSAPFYARRVCARWVIT